MIRKWINQCSTSVAADFSRGKLWHFLIVFAVAGWWGALTFYGMVVVPADSRVRTEADR